MHKVIRCNRKVASPYLREWLPKLKLNLPKDSRIVDLGCGNGRNSKFMLENGFSNIRAFDLKGDYGTQVDLSYNGIPLPNKSADFILCNYLLCFMNLKERQFLAREIERISAFDCYLMVELYSGRQTVSYNADSILDLFIYWSIEHKKKDRFILRRLR